MDELKVRRIVEAALLAADGPLTVPMLVRLFAEGELDEADANKQVRDAIKVLQEDTEQRGVELKRVASGYRYQVRQDLSEWVSRLWDEKPPRYTRALLETLALIAYKQPVTRGDIEQVRGVSVSQTIMRTLVEREWIKVVGQREVPGRPSLYGTTKDFLDYFNLQSLDELPPLPEIRELIEPVLAEAVGPEAETGSAGAMGADANRDVEADTSAPANADMPVDVQVVVEAQPDTEAPDDEPDVVVSESDGEDRESADVVPLHRGVNPNS